MAWSTHPSVVTGQTWSASDENTYVKGNLDTLWPYTAALQVAYSTSATTLNKATASAALSVLRSNSDNTAIEFGALPVIYRRQGFDTTNWFATSTSTTLTNYTPSTSVIQTGCYSGTDRTITFPSAFSGKPIILAAPIGSAVYLSVISTAISTASFVFYVSTAFGVAASTASFNIVWLAIGSI